MAPGGRNATRIAPSRAGLAPLTSAQCGDQARDRIQSDFLRHAAKLSSDYFQKIRAADLPLQTVL
jgi:hypothetical protein